MARGTVTTQPETKAPEPQFVPRISLTLMQSDSGDLTVDVGVTEFITYSQKPGYTQLNLTGHKVLKVKETTDQIDRLVRLASDQPFRSAAVLLNF